MHFGVLAVFNLYSISVHAVSLEMKFDYSSSCVAGFNISAVAADARVMADASWVFRSTAEALLELHNPEVSVYGDTPFPTGKIPSVAWKNVNALSYIQPYISINPATLIEASAVGDPASLGVSAIVIGQTDSQYQAAAARQKATLFATPKAWNGAISHKPNTPELGADFVYMAPPFLAYYAVSTKSITLLYQTIQQCGLYRQILLANQTHLGSAQANLQGAWEHIVGAKRMDKGLWSTGNAWAAAGMARVLATAMKWSSASVLQPEIILMKGWIKEILDSAVKGEALSVEPSTGLLRNYWSDPSWFGETSGTALLAAILSDGCS